MHKVIKCRLVRPSLVVLAAIILAVGSEDAFAQEMGRTSADGFGYETLEDALPALRARPEVTISVQQGWTVATEPGGMTLWVFTPADHYGHPSGAKRSLEETEPGVFHVTTNLMCGAEKTACDQLAKEFNELDRRMFEDVQQNLTK